MFPDTTLRTRRLVIRPFNAADIPYTRASCAGELTQRMLPAERAQGRPKATMKVPGPG